MASAFPTTLPVRLDAQGRIDVDVTCPSCDYNLRMQRVEAACPECGHALDVVEREEADRLAVADPGWAAKVRRGVGLLHAGAWLMPLGILPGLVVGAAGVWCFTAREPGRTEGWAARGTRLSARWAPLAAAGFGLAFFVLLFTQARGWTVWSMMRRDASLLDLFFAAGAACLAVGLLEAWRVLFRLAARADGPEAARACRETWKRYLIAVAVIVGIAAATRLGDVWRVSFLDRHFVAVGAAAALVVLGTVIWAWWGTVRLTGRLKAALVRRTVGIELPG